MNIDDMTIGQAKQVAAMVQGQINTGSAAAHPFIGRYVLCRCYSAGVHTGTLVSLDGDRAILRNSRRLWSWKAKQGVALSGVAQYGLDSGKVDVMNPEIALTGVIEVIPCSDAAEISINGQ